MKQIESFPILVVLKEGHSLSSFLDLSRWVAALLVVVGHVRSLFFVNLEHVDHKTWMVKGFYFITGLGHEAVVIFFVMSGFLVGGKALKDFHLGQFHFRLYLIDRFSRIYTVYVAALFLGAALDWIGVNYFNVSGIYHGTFNPVISSLNYSVVDRLDFSVFLANLGASQTIIAPTFGSNGPLWSLTNEFWYYILFPLLLLVVIGRNGSHRTLVVRALAFIAVTVVLLYLTPDIVIYFLLWLMGALLVYVKGVAIRSPLAAFCLLVTALAMSRMKLFHSLNVPMAVFAHDFLIAMACSFLIIAFANSHWRHRIMQHRMHRFIADFSLSLYLTHFPLALLLVCMLMHFTGSGLAMQPQLKAMVYFTLVTVLTFAYAYIVSLVTEKQTGKVRAFLKKSFSLKTLSVSSS